MLSRLLRLIAIGLDLPADFFDRYFDAAISNIRTIRYLPGQHRARDGVFGVGARYDHTRNQHMPTSRGMAEAAYAELT